MSKNATTMRCMLSCYGSDLNGFGTITGKVGNARGARDTGERQIYIDQRVGILAVMATDRLARQVGLE